MKDVFKYKNFLGSIEVSIEDSCLHGKLLFINDLIIYEAESVDDLEKQFQAAVDDYLTTCAELGREPLKPFSGTFNVRIGPELHQQAAQYAILNGIKVNEVVKTAVSKFLNDPQREEVIHKHIHTHSHEFTFTQNIPLEHPEITGEKYDVTVTH